MFEDAKEVTTSRKAVVNHEWTTHVLWNGSSSCYTCGTRRITLV